MAVGGGAAETVAEEVAAESVARRRVGCGCEGRGDETMNCDPRMRPSIGGMFVVKFEETKAEAGVRSGRRDEGSKSGGRGEAGNSSPGVD